MQAQIKEEVVRSEEVAELEDGSRVAMPCCEIQEHTVRTLSSADFEIYQSNLSLEQLSEELWV